MLTSEFKDSHPATSWIDMVNMRHILVHGYYQIDSKIVWATIKYDLPKLKLQLADYLNELAE